MCKKCQCYKQVPEVLPQKKKGGKVVKTLLIIGAGIAVCKLVSKVIRTKKAEVELGNQYREIKKHINIFNGEKIRIPEGEAACSMDLQSAFSGVCIDLSDAVFTTDISIEHKSFCSGIDICIPEGINVQIDCQNTAGGVSAPETDYPGAPTIFIYGKLVASGLSVRVKQPEDAVECASEETAACIADEALENFEAATEL